METFDDFMKLDIRVGMITEAKFFERATKIYSTYLRIFLVLFVMNYHKLFSVAIKLLSLFDVFNIFVNF